MNAAIQDLSLKMAELATEPRLLMDAQRRSEERHVEFQARLAKVDERVVAVEERLAKVDERLVAVEQRLIGMARRQGSMDGRLGLLEGSDFEHRFHARERLGRFVRRPITTAAVEIDAYDEALDSGVIGQPEHEQVVALDHLFTGRHKATGRDVLVAFEVSKRVDLRDVERAAERASILRKAGLEVLAFAGGQRATRGAVSRAAELEVALILDREAGSDEPSDDPIE